MIIIKKAVKEDLIVILDLLAELGRPKPSTKAERRRFGSIIHRYILDKDKRLFLAYDGSKAVGLVSVILLTRLNRTSKEMYIPELVVSSHYQNMGIGRMLINYCIKMAKKECCYRIRLESGYPRKSSHQFYKKIGFVDYALTFKKELS